VFQQMQSSKVFESPMSPEAYPIDGTKADFLGAFKHLVPFAQVPAGMLTLEHIPPIRPQFTWKYGSVYHRFEGKQDDPPLTKFCDYGLLCGWVLFPPLCSPPNTPGLALLHPSTWPSAPSQIICRNDESPLLSSSTTRLPTRSCN
jgi:hypothetical protein